MKNTVFATLLFGIVVNAQAAPAQGAASGIQTSTDPARAAEVEKHASELNAHKSMQSPVFFRGKTDDGISILSGGNTVGDRVKMHGERSTYNLWVATVAKPSGAYLAEAKLHVVKVADKSVVLDRTMEGPWLLAELPPGKYEVSAAFKADGAAKDQTLSQRVTIAKKGQRQVVLRFDSPAEVSPAMDSPFKGNPFGSPAGK